MLSNSVVVPNNLADYQSGIIKAQTLGLIRQFESQPGETRCFPFSHLSQITKSNTRRLTPGCEQLLKGLSLKADKLSILELGPGAGTAAMQAREICESNSCQVSIWTVSLAPINPFLKPNFTFVEQRDGQEPKLFFGDRPLPFDQYAINGADIFSYARLTGAPAFLPLRCPYIDMQLIGEFPRAVPEKLGDFDLVIDQYGAFFYGVTQARTKPGIEKIFNWLAANMKAEASFFCYRCPPAAREIGVATGKFTLQLSESAELGMVFRRI